MQTIQSLPSSIKEWLNERGITDDVLLTYHIGWNGKSISIPVTGENGEFLFYKYRRSPHDFIGPKYTYDPGASMQIFGLGSVKRTTEIFI